MQKQALKTALKTVAPLALGFLGGAASAFFPTHFQAFCAGIF